MDELKVTAGQDALTAERAIAVRSIRAGKKVSKTSLYKLIDELKVCIRGI